MTLPYCVALCPTYRRSRMLANAIACFENQDYPESHRQMIIVDDSGELVDGQSSGKFTSKGLPTWSIYSSPERYDSLPAKYNAMLRMAESADVVFVWEDDDIYGSDHISSNARMCPMVGYVKSPTVWSLYTGVVAEESAAGRFHASLVISKFLLDKIKGWPNTKRGDFDQRFIAALNENGHLAVPSKSQAPTYCFRWGSTHSYHGQSFMKNSAYEYWYEDVSRRTQPEGGYNSIRVIPKLDEDAIKALEMMEQYKNNYERKG